MVLNSLVVHCNIFILVTCSSVSLANGAVSYNQSALTNGMYSLNTKASFTCSSGYKLVGSSSTTCQGQGSWNKDIPTCAKGIVTQENINFCSNIVISTLYFSLEKQCEG